MSALPQSERAEQQQPVINQNQVHTTKNSNFHQNSPFKCLITPQNNNKSTKHKFLNNHSPPDGHESTGKHLNHHRHHQIPRSALKTQKIKSKTKKAKNRVMSPAMTEKRLMPWPHESNGGSEREAEMRRLH